jgi:UDP-N-acetylmuramoyl-tripeptide--D-alanyl-D-alanine ligase
MNKDTSLAILQQSEYDLDRWQAWLQAHRGESLNIQPGSWTPKLKLIKNISSALFFLPQTLAIITAVKLSWPLEYVIRRRAYATAKTKLNRLRKNGLIVVAIAGSYAKTSTKNILAHTLSGSHQVLITPKSINTMLGVAQVIETSLTADHSIFVVELGEYHRGDIKQLCTFVEPDYGILTPIGHQHLEILGGFQQVVEELIELVMHFANRPERVLVHEVNAKHLHANSSEMYGESQASQWQVLEPSVSRAGTEFTVKSPGTEENLKLFSPLFGEHQAVNTLPSLWLANKLKIPLTELKKKISTLPYIHRRHEPTFAQNNVLILDNSYNTNADAVTASLKLLNQLEPTRRIIITLGFTETGSEAESLHYQLGQQLAKAADYVGLIQAPWTTAIVDGFTAAGGHRDHLVVGATQDDAFKQLQEYSIPGTVILFEGGYQEVYV